MFGVQGIIFLHADRCENSLELQYFYSFQYHRFSLSPCQGCLLVSWLLSSVDWLNGLLSKQLHQRHRSGGRYPSCNHLLCRCCWKLRSIFSFQYLFLPPPLGFSLNSLFPTACSPFYTLLPVSIFLRSQVFCLSCQYLYELGSSMSLPRILSQVSNQNLHFDEEGTFIK